MATPSTTRPGRNEPCHCGSGKKYKHCCLEKDEAAAREARAKAEKAAAAASEAEPPAAEDKPEDGKDKGKDTARPHEKRHSTAQPWKGGRNTRALPKFSTPRRSGSS